MNIFKHAFLKLVLMYSMVILLSCSVALGACLWVAILDRGYGMFEALQPGTLLVAFLFHVWMAWAANRSLNGKSTRVVKQRSVEDGHVPSKYRGHADA